jgi:predicted nucleic acid-binding protein
MALVFVKTIRLSCRTCALSSLGYDAWDDAAAEADARIRIHAKRQGRSAGIFDIMIAAHADALGATLVTNDAAIKNLAVDG